MIPQSSIVWEKQPKYWVKAGKSYGNWVMVPMGEEQFKESALDARDICAVWVKMDIDEFIKMKGRLRNGNKA